MDFPITVLEPWHNYRRAKSLKDPLLKIRFLEYTSAAVIKHIALTFVAIGHDLEKSLFDQALLRVFSSSSLGGWLDFVDLICRGYKRMTPDAQKYVDLLNLLLRKHTHTDLISCEQKLNSIYGKLRRRGYELADQKNLSLLRLLRGFVELRNKFAHGALDLQFYSDIEEDYAALLRCVLNALPFDVFSFFGARAGYSIRLAGPHPTILTTTPSASFWTESAALKAGRCETLMLAFYNSESEEVFFLNTTVSEGHKGSEHICYKNGAIMSSQIIFDWRSFKVDEFATPRITSEAYKASEKLLSRPHQVWHPIDLSIAAQQLTSESTMAVYVFYVTIPLLNEKVTHVLYVGKTKSLKTRLATYLRIKKRYDDSRSEITRMFEIFGDDVKFKYSSVTSEMEALKLERAIYDVMKPQFNSNTPPQLKEDTDG